MSEFVQRHRLYYCQTISVDSTFSYPAHDNCTLQAALQPTFTAALIHAVSGLTSVISAVGTSCSVLAAAQEWRAIQPNTNYSI